MDAQPTADNAPADDNFSAEALAEQIGAMRIEPEQMRYVVYGTDRLNGPGAVKIDTANPVLAHGALRLRLGAAEKEWLFAHDSGFRSALAGRGELSDDDELKTFIGYLETNGLDAGRTAGAVLAPHTIDNVPLRCIVPIGASATGWFAMIAATPGGAPLLYYTRDQDFVQESPDAPAHYRWRALDPADQFGEHAVRCAAIGGHHVAVADAVRKLLVLYDLTRPGVAHRLKLADQDMPARLAAAEARIALLSAAGCVMVLWLDPASAGAVGTSAELAGATGFGKLQCAPDAAATAGKFDGVKATGGALGLDGELTLTPSAIAVDQLDPSHIVVGTVEGVCAAFDAGTPGQLAPVEQWQMYESGQAGVHRAEAVVSRRPWADGFVATLTAASLATRCPAAIQAALAGAATRYPALYERGTESVMCVQLCGTNVVAHKASEGVVLLGSVVPFKDGTTEQHILRSRPTMLEAVPAKPAAVASYHSVYAEIEHASVLLHTGAIVRVQLAR